MKNSNFLKVFSILLAVCMAAMLCATPAVAVSTWDGSSASTELSGTGTAADPYLIKSAEDLKFFADNVNGVNGDAVDYSGKVIYLQADIDLANQAFDPIGSTSHYFRGQFDGKNHTISGLNVSSNLGTGTGLFGGLHNGWIKNLHVEGSVICTLDAANYVGGLVGYTSGNITIYNCSFNGLVRSANTNANRGYCGGLVGYLAACSAGANIVCSYTSGTVDVFGRSGGLVGGLENNASDILNIKDSYSDAIVTGSSAGTSTFDAAGTAGGILGFLQNGTVNMVNCFFAGKAPSKRSSGYAGPIINHKAGGTLNLTRVYFDNEKNLLGASASFAAADDGTGQSTNNMTYSIWGNFPTTFIAGNATVKHPILRVSDMGKGTKDDPYVIDGTYDLRYLSYICGYGGLNIYGFRDDYIVFESDIDMSSVASFTPLGSGYGPFYGNVDGKGHTVSNVTITQNHRQGVGFFGKTGYNAIKNLNVTGTVTNNMRPDTTSYISSPVAGFAAITVGTCYITNCSFDGTVFASNNLVSNGSGGYSINDQNYASAGGLVCSAEGTLAIDRCSVSGTVDGFGRSGGLVSSLNGAYTVTIKNSYCDADVTGKGPVDSSLSNLYTAGGLIGYLNNGTITLTNCFFAGTFPAARANGMAGPIINHKAGGTFNCTNVYYLADSQAEVEGQEFGVYKNAAWFASAAAATALSAHFAEGDPHPVFASPDLLGEGSESNPYLIKTAADFQALNTFVRGGYRLEDLYFKLANDIVINENYANYATWGSSAPANNWLPVGTKASQFAGNLDGADHTIYGLYASYAEADTAVGFFGGTYRGTIKDLHIKNAYVSGYYPVGGMSGFAQESTYSNCSFEGIVYSTNTADNAGQTGGLIGNAGMGNKLERCMTAGTVDAYSRSAGLIGAANASGKNYIYDSYSTMDVTGLGTQASPGAGTGGLVGLVQNGTVVIDSCFFAGSYPNGSAVRGPIIGQNSNQVEETNCWYLADEGDGLFGDLADEDEFADGTVRDSLQVTRSEIVWIQGTTTPVLAIKGDLNCDTIIDLADAMMAIRHINSVAALSAGAASLADLDADGSITMTDYSAIKVKALNAIEIEEEPLALSAWSNFG